MKEFRQLFDKIDKWLGQLYRNMGTAQQQLGKIYPQVDQDTQKRIDAIMLRVGDVRDASLDQAEPLRLLKMAPPSGFAGLLTSVVDFAYNVLIDPKAPSKKKQHRDAIKQLRKNFLDRTLSYIGSSMGLGPDAPRTTVINLMKSLGLDHGEEQSSIREQLERVVISVFPMDDLGASPVHADEAAQLLSNVAKSPDKFTQIRDALRIRLKELNDKAPRKKVTDEEIDARLNELQFIPSTPTPAAPERTGTLIIRKAEQDQLYREVESIYKKVVAIRNESEKFLPFASMARNIGAQKEKGEQLDLCMRYYSYIQALFGPTASQSITRVLDQLAGDLKKLLDSLGKKAGIDSSKERGSAVSPKVEDTTPPPVEPPSANQEPLPTDKTGALQAQKRKIYSLLKNV